MDNKEKDSEKEGCCGSNCGCCGRHCLSGKAALALVLLLIGSLLGYGVARCRSAHMACSYSAPSADATSRPAPGK